jgi:SAM-dependent methyltransferase
MIPNITRYTDGMKKSLLDKVFFMDKIDSDFFVDYGCADGTMLKFMKELFPDYMYVGYDICPEMLQLAKHDCEVRGANANIRDITFTNDWNIPLKLKDKSSSKTLILSSIIHEIYSYESKQGVSEFWSRVFDTGFEYIVIRDMMLSNSSDRSADIADIVRIQNKSNKSRLSEFENKWGRITNNKTMIHWLLKYRYDANWSRELDENYLPITKEGLTSLFPENYQIIFHEHYLLPYLKEQTHCDFGIELKDHTHVKFILKKIK